MKRALMFSDGASVLFRSGKNFRRGGFWLLLAGSVLGWGWGGSGAGWISPVEAASPAEARGVAIAANCLPNKIEVLRHIPGSRGETVFKIECSDVKGQFVVVQCRVRQCVLLR